jgi:hypothetical protein
MTLFAATSAVACAAQSPGQLPDMSLRVECPGQPSAQNLSNIKHAMFEAGFDVIDRVQLAEEQHIDYPFVVQIDAIDKVGHEIEVSTMYMKEGIYPPPKSEPFQMDAALYSKPPTHRDAVLEQSIQQWVTSGLGCTIAKVDRYANGPNVEPIYSVFSGNKRDWIKQARDLHASTNSLLAR